MLFISELFVMTVIRINKSQFLGEVGGGLRFRSE